MRSGSTSRRATPAASHKPYQLALAQEIGIDIPPTLMTNDVEEARAFWRRYEGEVIYKQFLALPAAWRETRQLGPEDEAQADCHCPCAGDLPEARARRRRPPGHRRRRRVFRSPADVRNAEYPQDVRINLAAKYEPHDLPTEVAAKLGELMRRLGLVSGAIDLRLTPESRYVFLEINPAGQFLYVEHATRQPIAAALAKALIEKPLSKPAVLRRQQIDATSTASPIAAGA